jgi:hypothetical protein
MDIEEQIKIDMARTIVEQRQEIGGLQQTNIVLGITVQSLHAILSTSQHISGKTLNGVFANQN